MKALGKHLLVELYGCQHDLLNDLELIKKSMLEAAELCGATIVGEVFHQFSPQGTSGAIVIAESHFTIHTWPELGYAALDFYTCADTTNPWIAFDFMKKALNAEQEEIKEIERGIIPNH